MSADAFPPAEAQGISGSTDLPKVEQIWVVEATYAPDAAQRRGEFRAEHLARVVELKAAGTLLEAGAYGDLTASLLLLRADGRDEALGLCRQDVYFREGIWTALSAKEFGRVV